MQICEFTGKQTDERHITKTQDGYNILYSLYYKSCLYYQKGNIDNKEVLCLQRLQCKYKETIENHINILRRFSNLYNIDMTQVYNMFLDIEQMYSMLIYKKYYKCLTIKEHMDIIDMIQREHSLDRTMAILPKNGKDKKIDFITKYMKERFSNVYYGHIDYTIKFIATK